MEEIWKEVKGFEDYHISSFGNIKSLKRCKEIILKGGIDNSGYKIVSLRNISGQKTRTIHQLVAESFLNHTPCGYDLVVDHKDDNKLNNHKDNLQLITARYNSNKNRHANTSSKYTGVGWCKTHKKWLSRIYIKGKRICLGYFVNEIDAHNAYQEKLKTLAD